MTVEIFYDFRSPYCYFAAHDLAVEPLPGAEPTWRAVSIHMLLNLQRGRAPLAAYEDPLPPVKRAYLLNDVVRGARMRGLPLQPPASLDSRTLMEVSLGLEGNPAEPAFRAQIWRAFWAQRCDLSDPGEILACAQELDGFLGGSLRAEIETSMTRDALPDLIDRTGQAFGRGVFGVPSFVVDDEVFFGADRLDALRWRLEARRTGAG